MNGFITFITDLQNLLSIGVGVLVFATVMTLLSSLTKGQDLDKRIKAVNERREELRRRSRAAMQGANGQLRHTDEGFKKRVVERLNLVKLLEDPKVEEKMTQAGFRGPKPLTTFYFFRFASPFIFMAFTALYLYGINGFGMTGTTKLCFIVGATVVGFYAPNVYLTNRIAKRKASIMQAFPDALDLLLICVEAGMSIEAAVSKVSQEVGSSSIELAEELTLLSAELSYLPNRSMAYNNLGKRTDHPGVKSVSTAMVQAETYGTPLSAALRTMAKENRELRLSAAEKKAAALPAKLTVPMILFILPVLFLVIMGPAVISIIDTLGSN